MKVWTNTNTLDGLIDDLVITSSKQEAEVALLGSKPITLDEFPNLKGIFRAGVGSDNVPIEEAKKRGIKVEFPSEKTINFILEETANFACYLIMRMLYINVGSLSPWEKYNRSFLGNRKLLIIGKGKIGTMVMNKLGSMLKILTYDVSINSQDELEQMIKDADCISLHIPASPENKGFFGASKLSLMKNGASLINTARGSVVDEDALFKELESERIYAAFDVYWKEPYEGKLKKFHPDRFFMTPHVASTCDEFLRGSAEDLRKLVQKLKNIK